MELQLSFPKTAGTSSMASPADATADEEITPVLDRKLFLAAGE